MNRRWHPALSGALAGALNGMFGAGGGILLVPLLMGRHGLPPRRAFATSLAVMVPLSLVTAGVYALRGQLAWQGALPYLLGGAAGGLLAGKWLKKLPVAWLRRGFGLLLILAGLRAVLA